MKSKSLWIAAVLAFLVSGCASAPHKIGYDVIKPALPVPSIGKICILPFTDQRPKEEKTGVKGKLLKFSSKDAHFSQEITEAITQILSVELENAGFSIVEEKERHDYKISGKVTHFQAVISPAKITFVPYLGSISTLWAKDEFSVALSIQVKMTDKAGKELIDQLFDVSDDMKLPTGLLSLARYSRGFNYKLKLLDEALKDVLGQIRDQVVAKVKEQENRLRR